jgi:hypothetical protein
MYSVLLSIAVNTGRSLGLRVESGKRAVGIAKNLGDYSTLIRLIRCHNLPRAAQIMAANLILGAPEQVFDYLTANADVNGLGWFARSPEMPLKLRIQAMHSVVQSHIENGIYLVLLMIAGNSKLSGIPEAAGWGAVTVCVRDNHLDSLLWMIGNQKLLKPVRIAALDAAFAMAANNGDAKLSSWLAQIRPALTSAAAPINPVAQKNPLGTGGILSTGTVQPPNQAPIGFVCKPIVRLRS